MMKKRSVFAENVPGGFPNLSAIRERLIRFSDSSAVEFWRDGFDPFAQAVLESIGRFGKCTQNQGNLIAKECLLVAQRRMNSQALSGE
jgi:hypothetical protein